MGLGIAKYFSSSWTWWYQGLFLSFQKIIHIPSFCIPPSNYTFQFKWKSSVSCTLFSLSLSHFVVYLHFSTFHSVLSKLWLSHRMDWSSTWGTHTSRYPRQFWRVLANTLPSNLWSTLWPSFMLWCRRGGNMEGWEQWAMTYMNVCVICTC